MKTTKKHVVSLVLVVALLLGCIGYADVGRKSTAATKEPDLVINTLRDLNDFSNLVTQGNTFEGKLVVLNADIDYQGMITGGLSRIGGKEKEFLGTFDGGGHTIKNVNMVEEYVGLFARVGSKGIVRNVMLSDSVLQSTGGGAIYTDKYIGGIANKNYGIVQNCCVIKTELTATSNIGNIVCNNQGKVINCFAINNSMKSGCDAGGIVQYNNGSVLNSCNLSDVLGSYEYTGGIVGDNRGGTIENCYNAGKVTGGKYCGGIAGYVQNGGVASNCYTTEDAAEHRIGSVATDSKELNCEFVSRGDMATEAFRTRLNTNRNFQADTWSEWVISSLSDLPTPVFPYGAVTATPTLAPTAAPVVTPVPTAAPVVTLAPTAAPVATPTPIPDVTPTPTPDTPTLYPNPMTAKGKTVTVKSGKLKKKSVKIKRDKAFSIKNAIGKLIFSKKKGISSFKVSKNGTITIKKGLKKDTYKVYVYVKASGTSEFESKTVGATVTFRII
ncbi:MAG: hypothetical protein J5819_00475 [Eubacterium sp.]|nr:hypothetical protein [Eubacterium sp.]